MANPTPAAALTPYQEKILRTQGWMPKKCRGYLRELDDNGRKVPCGRWAVRGLEVCPKHGGNTPQAKRKAKKVVRDETLKRAMVTYGLPMGISPQAALTEELARTNGHVEWLADQIQGMESGDLIWGQIEESRRSGGADENNWDEEKVGAVMHLWIQLYLRERSHLVKIADLMQKNGLSAVSLRLQERQLDLMETGLLGMARALGHSDTDPAVRSAVALSLRTMAEAAKEPLEIEGKAP